MPYETGYTLEIVNDARDYADHAGRVDIGMDDVRLAVRKKQDTLTAGPPSREVTMPCPTLRALPSSATVLRGMIPLFSF